MPVKILVVDDEVLMEEMIRMRFRKEIRRNVYDFHFAISGQATLDYLEQEEGIEIILLDINMPEMDGLTLMNNLKQKPYLLKIIMVTAYGNMDNIRASMNRGAFDFITKPIDIHDLRATIQKAEEELNQIREGEAARKQLPLTQQELAKTDEKARYLEELDHFKTRFFTNISHEFRTPLTVIKGMVKQIKENPDQWQDKGHDLILRNTHQLLDLVNQILDLQKLESGKLQVNLVKGEVVSFFRYLAESFQTLAELKQINFSFQASEDTIWMDYDPEKMLRIFSNLISNAIKFTDENGKIEVNIEQGVFEEKVGQASLPVLQITIKDSGIGIPEEKLRHIFDRFYQVDGSSSRKGEGTGIGLSLTKELVQVLDGEITVESQTGVGTRFQLTFPISQQAPQEKNQGIKDSVAELLEARSGDAEPQIVPAITSTEDQPRLLIVEDNADVVTYLLSCLNDQYSLLIARDGQQGIDMALEHIPDLIISDVMMPNKDGFELCKRLKRDARTSHIPIVLLTARSDHASRIDGLRRGADAYLAKPFAQEELLIRLEKLMAVRKALQARYSGAQPSLLPPSKEHEQEDAFFSKLHQILEEHHGDTDFSVPRLCRMIGMSRSTLHRKVHALTNKSISIVIREFRFQKAIALLTSTDKAVADIAYEVGFSDPSYFSRIFSLEYGTSPLKMRHQNR
ncbi:MAG: response regulator [Bacteroidota bacterium]